MNKNSPQTCAPVVKLPCREICAAGCGSLNSHCDQNRSSEKNAVFSIQAPVFGGPDEGAKAPLTNSSDVSLPHSSGLPPYVEVRAAVDSTSQLEHSMLTSNGAATRQTPAVGVSDFARELQIKHYGNLVVRAMAAGDRHTANNWLQAQMLAIAQRSPAQQARMTADIEQAISDGNDYFAVQGAMRAAA